MVCEIEHFFMYLLNTCKSVKYLIISLPFYWNWSAFFDICLFHFLVCSACQSLVRCTIYKYFLPFWVLSLKATDDFIFCKETVFTLIDYWNISSLFYYNSFLGRGLRFRSVLSLLIYMVGKWDDVSFLCIQTSNWVSTILWKDCHFPSTCFS